MDRGFQFDFMSIHTIINSSDAHSSARIACSRNEKKRAMFFWSVFFSLYVCMFVCCSHVWTSSGILYILSSSRWWFFFDIFVVAVHHNPHCAYVVRPHCFRINSISLLYIPVCLFVYYLKILIFSLSSPPYFSIFIWKRMRSNNNSSSSSSKNRLRNFTSAREVLSSKHTACKLICQFVRFPTVCEYLSNFFVSALGVVHRFAKYWMRVTQIYFRIHVDSMYEREKTRKCYTFMANIYIHIYLFNIANSSVVELVMILSVAVLFFHKHIPPLRLPIYMRTVHGYRSKMRGREQTVHAMNKT